jgi:4-coumarate--CoA ligase
MGYLGNPKATAESISAMEGWFRTGDIGYQDKEGNFYIPDRAKELIKYKGFQVAPAELDGTLLENEAVDDVAVIGIESQEYGTEVPRAYVVLSKKIKSDICEAEEAAKIIQWVEKRVAHHKRLRGGVRFLDVIPKSANGKILRRVLKQALKDREAGTSKAKI